MFGRVRLADSMVGVSSAQTNQFADIRAALEMRVKQQVTGDKFFSIKTNPSEPGGSLRYIVTLNQGRVQSSDSAKARKNKTIKFKSCFADLAEKFKSLIEEVQIVNSSLSEKFITEETLEKLQHKFNPSCV